MAPDWLRALAVGLDAPEFWFLFGAMALGAPVLLYKGTQAFWRLRTVADTPTARIHSAPQGYVELAGFARPHLGTIEGPLSGRPCLWYRYRIERRGGGRRQEWRPVEQGVSHESFRLDDGSGQCIVDPAGALMRARTRDAWTGARRHPQGGTPTRWYQASDQYRYTEERIHDGDPLYCLGRFETPLRGPAERHRLQGALLRVWKQDPGRMARFDTDGDGDGRVSPEDMGAGAHPGRRPGRTRRARTPHRPRTHPARGNRGLPPALRHLHLHRRGTRRHPAAARLGLHRRFRGPGRLGGPGRDGPLRRLGCRLRLWTTRSGSRPIQG